MKQNYLIRFFLMLCFAAIWTPSLSQYQMENLDRGVVATSMGGTKVFISWRWLGTEPDNIAFNLYRGTTKLNATPLTVCNYTDNAGSTTATYSVRAVLNGVEQTGSNAVTPWAQQFLKVPIQPPAGGTTPDGVAYTYNANDASVADLDGDGQYEIILKWDPSNSKDNSQSGYTGNTYVDAYKMNGTRLWRIDFGLNIRSGAHYMDFMVYDFDGDGKAEMMCRTGDGTKDGVGTIIGTANADYRNTSGYVLSGPEYISVFNGMTGAAMATSNYIPARGTVSSWGDSYGNRVDRFRAGVAYVDGQHPTGIFSRGYYTRAVVAAWDWRGGKLTNRWTFDSNTSGNSSYAGQGDHSLSIADVDNDGKQEIIVGSAIIDDNGLGYYNTTFGHGDALHVSDLDPDLPGLEVFNIQERLDVEGAYMYSAKDKKVLWTKPTLLDGSQTEGPGRGVCGDITAAYRGAESWVAGGGIPGTWDCKGNQISATDPVSCNFLVWWDGDLLRELLNNTMIDKYGTGRLLTAYNLAPISSNNGTKSTPALSGDIFGDWREEVIWRGTANDALYIFTTNTPSIYKFRTFMHDPQYRVAIAWQNTGYNQPPHVGFYLGDGMTTPTAPNIVIVGSTTTNTPPTVNLTAPANNTSVCSGTPVTLTATASDANGTVSKVELFDGTALIATFSSSPYTYNWTNAGAGVHTITAIATDNVGASTTSAVITLTVNSPTAIVPYVQLDGVTWLQQNFAQACVGSSVAIGPQPTTATGWTWTGPNNFTSSTRQISLTNLTTSQSGVYIATFKDANGCSSASSITVTVNSLPSLPTVSTTPVTYCQNATAAALTATGASLKWYTVSTGGTGSATAPTPVTTTAGTTNYYVSQTTNNCESPRAMIAVTINALPAVPTVSTPVTYCQNATAAALTATGASLKWYTVSTGGTGSTTAPTPVTATAGTINYYVSQTTNNCESPRAMIAVTINALPAVPTVSTPVTYCQNATAAALTATGASLKWYTVSTGGTGSATAPAPVTATAGTINYYVSQTTNNCESPRAMIAVTVNALPAVPTVSTPVTYCQNATAADLTATGASLKWYTVSTGGTGSTTAPTPVTATAGTINYYVSQTTNNCESPRAMIAVTVNALPSTPAVSSPITYCQNATAAALSATGTSLNWYTVLTGGTGSATAPTPVTTVAGTTNYYVSQTSNNCESPRSMIAVTINAPIAIVPFVQLNGAWLQQSSAQVCAGSLVIGPQPTNAAGWSWTGPNNFNASTREISLTNISSAQSGIYVATYIDVNTCPSTSNFTITVNTLPSAPAVNSPVTYCQNATPAALSATGSSLKWYTVSTGGIGSATAPTPVTSVSGTTNYYVSQTTNNCESERAIVTVTVNPEAIATITAGGPVVFCQGGSVMLTASSGTSYKWFNGSVQVSSSSNYTATTTGDYTLEVNNVSNCKAISPPLAVTVNALPVADITANGPLSFPQGGSVILSSSGGTTYKWFNQTNQVGTNSTYTASTSGVYTVEVMNALGCKNTSSPVTVTVNSNQLPQVDITAPLSGSNYVEAATVIIEASASDADGTISMVEFYIGNTLLGSDASAPYSFTWTSVMSGTYNITAKATDNLGGTGVSSAVNITVNVNQPSVIAITSPVNNSNTTGNSVTINVSATDPDGNITLVEYYDGTTLIGSSSNQPYNYTWDNVTAGTHEITVKVTDSNGGVTTSSPTSVSVGLQTGIFSISGIEAFSKIYPNPSGGMVQIETSINLETASITCIDALGSEVFVQLTITEKNAVMDVSYLTPGIYTLTISADNFIARNKIIVIH